jgi:hypothetical protein
MNAEQHDFANDGYRSAIQETEKTIMTALNHCQCQSGQHGHRPGECSGQSTESDKLCKDCHDKAAREAMATIQPLSEPQRRR